MGAVLLHHCFYARLDPHLKMRGVLHLPLNCTIGDVPDEAVGEQCRSGLVAYGCFTVVVEGVFFWAAQLISLTTVDPRLFCKVFDFDTQFDRVDVHNVTLFDRQMKLIAIY